MSIVCPHCRSPAPAGVVAGKAYACPKCGNPVLAADEEPESPALPAPPAPPPPHAAWKIAALALAVLAAAHAGLFALLTAEDRRERAGILQGDGPAVLEARDPGPRPEDDKGGKYRAARELWKDRQRFEDLSGRVTTLGTWLAAAYAAQAGLVLFVLVKASQRARARERAPSRARTPGP